MALNGLAARERKLDWQVAPACHEITNYDDVKIKYRQSVEEIVHQLPARSLKRMTFITISTNVMCADLESKKPDLEPIERDIYFPLEICLAKSTVADAKKDREERQVKIAFWMFNPGPPPANGSVKYAKDQKENFHKIDYDRFRPNDTYVETDICKVVKEINAFLTPEKILYSTELRNCRQDLGCLKWLNRKAGGIMKPVKVFSIEDLNVVLNRRLYPRVAQKDFVCLGVSRLRFESSQDTYDPENQCRYHQDKLNEDSDAATRFCAKAVAVCTTHALLDEIFNFEGIEEDLNALPIADSSVGH